MLTHSIVLSPKGLLLRSRLRFWVPLQREEVSCLLCPMSFIWNGDSSSLLREPTLPFIHWAKSTRQPRAVECKRLQCTCFPLSHKAVPFLMCVYLEDDHIVYWFGIAFIVKEDTATRLSMHNKLYTWIGQGRMAFTFRTANYRVCTHLGPLTWRLV